MIKYPEYDNCITNPAVAVDDLSIFNTQEEMEIPLIVVEKKR